MKSLIIGHMLLIICCLFYLAWWCFSFRPGFEGSKVTGLPGALLLITAITGLSGTGFLITGINQAGSRPALIPSGLIIIGGIVLYILLFIGTSVCMHRQVTTELLLIIGWLVLECLSYQKVYCMERIDIPSMVLLLIIASVAAICSLFFYLQYYRVDAIRGFIYGMIPLITEALSMIAFLLACLKK